MTKKDDHEVMVHDPILAKLEAEYKEASLLAHEAYLAKGRAEEALEDYRAKANLDSYQPGWYIDYGIEGSEGAPVRLSSEGRWTDGWGNDLEIVGPVTRMVPENDSD